VAKSKIPPEPVFANDAPDVESPKDRADWEEFVGRTLAEGNLAKDLHKKLLNGAKNELSRKKIEPTLDLNQVGEFLAWISYSNKATLERFVKSKLDSLGIGLHPRGPGRPKGRNTESTYAQYVEWYTHAIEQCGVLTLKTEFREQYGGRWSDRFREELKLAKWSPQAIDCLLDSQHSRSCAIRRAAQEFGVSRAAIESACRRAAKSAKK
jgi:hypothetical protein